MTRLQTGLPGNWDLTCVKGRDSSFFTASRLALVPTQPRVQCVLVAFCMGAEQPEHEADDSFPSTARVPVLN